MECTETRHVLASLDDTTCQCGAVVVIEQGVALAADPENILQPVAAPRIDSAPDSQSWTFKVQP